MANIVKYRMIITVNLVKNFLESLSKSVISNISPISGGDWSQAFFFTIGGKEKVARFSQTDEDFLKDKFAHKFTSAELPIPEIEKLGLAFGGYYAVSSRIAGKMIDNLSHNEMQLSLPALFDLFNSLKTTDILQTEGYGGWNADGKGQKESWKSFLMSVNEDHATNRIDWRPKLNKRPEALAVFQKVYQEIIRLLDYCPEDRHLIHNDLLHYNLIINNHQIAGVIDWGCSLYGDFLYDLAMFDLWQFYYPSMAGIDFKQSAINYFQNHGLELKNFAERLKCYQCHLALDAIKYCSYKDNDKDLGLIINRVKDLID